MNHLEFCYRVLLLELELAVHADNEKRERAWMRDVFGVEFGLARAKMVEDRLRALSGDAGSSSSSSDSFDLLGFTAEDIAACEPDAAELVRLQEQVETQLAATGRGRPEPKKVNKPMIRQAVCVPIAMGLSQCQHEYGWNSRSCTPGSLNIMLNLLLGRMDNIETFYEFYIMQNNDGTSLTEDASASNVSAEIDHPQYRKTLEQVLNHRNDLEHTRAEAMSRLTMTKTMYETRVYVTGSLECGDLEEVREEVAVQVLKYQAEIEEILDVMVMGEHYEVAVNRLRGLFFQQLLAESEGRLAKLRNAANGAGRGVISEDLANYLTDLYAMAQIFTQSFERDGEMGKCMQEALLSQQLPEPMPFLDSDESVADDDGWGKLMDTTKFLSLDSDDDKSTTPSTEDLNGSRTMKASTGNQTVGKWNDEVVVENKVSQGPESMTLGLEDLYAVEASAF